MNSTSSPSTVKVKYDDTAAKILIYPSIVFMILGMIFGVFIAFNTFVFPDYFSGEYIHFGKVRPMHVGHVLFLWLLSADVGLLFFFVPRLCGIPLWSNRLAYIAAVFWWFSLIIGIYSFPWGTNFGWEYAELPTWIGWLPIKGFFLFSIVLIGVNLYVTIINRINEKMYVSLWYTMGTLFWTLFTVSAGYFMINFVPNGISKVNVSFFYVHNVVGLIFTPMGLAQAYYFLPKIAKTPIYSHRMSMLGFWSIAFTYAWIGTHHIIHGPVSQWLQTTSIVFSIWLFIPVWTVVTNLFATLKPQWQQYSQSAPLRFIMMGTAFYLLTCIQGPLMALRNVNEITSKTDWVIGHSHVSLYGTFTFFAFAGIYQAIPAMTNKPLWSNKLANLHFSLNLLGSVPFMLSIWIGGFWQGMEWATWADGNSYAEFHNNFTKLSFIDTISSMYPFWVWRGIGGIIVLFANILFAINMFNTIVLHPAPQKEKRNLELQA